MPLDNVRELVRYSEWADSQFFKRWKDLSEAHGNEEIRKLTDHFTFVQKLFLQSLQGEESTFPDPKAPSASFAELRERCVENHARLGSYMSSLQKEELSAPVNIPWFPGHHNFTVHQALLQIVMHTQHHRAQVLQALARYAEKPLIIDWIFWTYKGQPAPSWD